MKMSKKVREYKAGDFIFAKVKGYPAWPARVQRPNGKKYFVYFYGTGETANLAPNMIFDYAENKDKFLSKSVKRRDFNDGVKQIEHDFANNVPLEQVIGVAMEVSEEAANDTANDSTTNDTIDESTADTTAAEDTTVADESTVNATPQNETMVEDSDDAGALVIDEGKKGRKSTAKPTGKETPKPVKEPKTPRGKKKEEAEESKEEDKKEEEIVSRSGRKIRPKRYIDEQTEDNATLPSPAPKKRRGASPVSEKVAEEKTEKIEPKAKGKQFNTVTQAELEDLKEPFTSDKIKCSRILQFNITSGNQESLKQNVSMQVKTIPRLSKDSKKINSMDSNSINISVAKPRKFVPPTKVTVNSVDNNKKIDNSLVDKCIDDVEDIFNKCSIIKPVNNCTHDDKQINKESSHANRIDNYSKNNSGLINNNSLNTHTNNSKSNFPQNNKCLNSDLYDQVSKPLINYNRQTCVFPNNDFDDFINNNNPPNNFVLSDNDLHNIPDCLANLDIFDNNELDNLIKPVSLDQFETDASNFKDDFNFKRLDTNSNEFIKTEDLSKKYKNDKSKFALDGLLIGSLNVLNDSTSFTQNITQVSNASNNSNTANISRNESVSSVVTLNKTYKNLDLKSFENRVNLTAIEINNNCEEVSTHDSSDNSSHKIPKGDDYLNLFKSNTNNRRKKSKKYVAMSTDFGDMGFNVKYSEYIKQYGYYYEDCGYYDDITRKILLMYPNENKILYDRLFNK